MFYKREGAPAAFWDGFAHATLDQMPVQLREAFLKVNPDPEALQRMFDKDVRRMQTFKGWSDEELASVTAPTLIVQGNTDVGSLDHALEMHRKIAGSELAVLPGAHGTYMGARESLTAGRWTMSYFADLLLEYLERSR